MARSTSTSTLPTPRFELTAKQQEANRLLAGPQRHTLLVGGSRSGKTFVATRALVTRAIKAPASRHCLFRLRFNALRASVWLDTLPKVMRLCYPGVPYENKRQDGYVLLPHNGSEIWFAGLDERERVEKILGMEFATLYFNECSQIPRASVLTALTRLAQQVPGLKNRAYYDLNPTGTGHWTYKEFIEHVDPDSRQPQLHPDEYRSLYINPLDNARNIDPAYIQSLEAMPERQRRRFLDGRYVAEIDGALWTLELLERQRITEEEVPELKRIVVVVDPSGCSGPEDKRSDEVGLAVCGLGVDDKGYLLADASGRMGPEAWGRRACELYHAWKADCVVGEINFGGDMVRAVVQGQDRNVPFRMVTASRGKVQRAEPVSSLYEQGRIFQVGRWPALEDQLVNFSTAGYLGERSPDRADAAVWGFTELMLGIPNDSYIQAWDQLLADDAAAIERERQAAGEWPAEDTVTE